MTKRILSILLMVAMLCSFVPVISPVVRGAETLISTSGAISTTAQEVNALFSARSEGQHPRILADADKFAEIRQRVQTDPYSKVLYARLYDFCLTELNTDVSIYDIRDGVRLLAVSREASSRIMWMAMVYQISGERRFADRAVAEMLAVSNFTDWHPSHYLDVAQMAYGVGIGYDWLYHYMSAAERKTISSALYNYAVVSGMNHGVHNSTSNWNPWCMAGLSIAAAAVYEEYPEDCSKLLAKSVSSIQNSLALFTPLGAYPEGPGYYRIGSEFSAIYFETMNSVLGTDFGLSDLPGVRESAKYLLAANGYVKTFNFGDCGDTLYDGAMLHWYANRYNMPELSVYQQGMQARNGEVMDDVLSLLWYNPTLVEGYSESNQQLDYLMYSDEYQSIASFRSFDADPAQVYAAIKSGYNSTSHADMDIGTFVMEAMGERWIVDMGSDTYNLPEYGKFSNGYGENIGRWTYYRKRTEGHNAIVINPGERGGQDAKSKAQISGYKSSYDGGFATVDMYDAYDSYGVTSANRGLMLFDNRSRVYLRDEITCSSASELYWFAHTQAEIAISPDGKTAELTMNGKTLLAQIVEPSNAVFTQMDANPLTDYSLDPANEKSREGYRKLVIHLENVTSANISVVFTPILEESDRNKALPKVTLATMGTQLNDYDKTTSLQANAHGVYEIYNVEQLCLLSDMVQKGNTFEGETLKLMNDIDMQGRTFQPIGGCGTTYSFRGTFDGGNHKIKNLCVFAPGVSDVGFFGRVYKATIRNLGIDNGVVFGGGRTAGLAGCASDTTIDNCYNKANVISDIKHVGGIVGELSYTSTITNCYNNAEIKCYSTVSGGIVGYIASKSTVTVAKCYHIGNLTDSTGRTGLIGYYNTGSGEYLVGTVTVDNCYSTTPMKSAAVKDDAEREIYTNCATVTEAELPRLATDLGSSFIYDCGWENDGYPVFKWQCDTVLPEDLALSTEAELRLLAYNVNSGIDSYSGKTVTLCNDIDLDSRQWVPIGGGSVSDQGGGKTFRGTFDGKGYGIKNLRITTDRSFIGFFGTVSGKVRNFGIKSGYVKGNDKVAGIAGSAGNGSKFDNCYNRASVEGVEFAGGIVGMSGSATFSNCYNTGPIYGSTSAGGLLGYFSSGATTASVENSYNTGKVSGGKRGALVCSFHKDLTGVVFTNCYALSEDNIPMFHTATGHTQTDCALLTDGEMKTLHTTLGTAFASDTKLSQNKGYPILNSSIYGTEVQVLEADSNGVYNIYSAEDLRSLSYMVNVLGNSFSGKTVKLCADIDLQCKEWIPIGGNCQIDSASRKAFGGTFDGNGYVIKNMVITSGNLYVGLFGFASGATIKNVGLESGVVFGDDKAAALVGSIRNATVIDNCYSKVNVTARTATGGIVGMIGGNGNSVVRNCYNTGAVSAKDKVAAGIVGYIASDGKNTKIQNCYNLGTQSAGIMGKCNTAVTTAEISNCYTIDTVELTYEPNSLIVTDCAKVASSDLMSYDTVLGTAFAKDYLVQNNVYPVLAWENGDAPTMLSKDENGVYLIGTAEELRLLSYLVRVQHENGFRDQQIRLTADIDLEGEPFLPIGGSGKIFRGNFDGDGHMVSNINAVNIESNYMGLFGAYSTGLLQNVGLESGVVIGKEHVGLVGNLSGGARMQNCYNKATVFANFHVGGLVGMINTNNVYVKNSYNTGAVYARKTITQAGGLVGYIASKTTGVVIENCYDVGSYNTVFAEINTTQSNAIIRNTYGVGGVKLVTKGSYTTEKGSTFVIPETMKSYAPVLGSAYAFDHLGVNQGYPVLVWEKSAEHTASVPEILAPTLTTQGQKGETVCLGCGEVLEEKGSLEILDKALFFDFDNSERANERYSNYVYNMESFDTAEAWQGRTSGYVNGSQIMDTKAGTLTVMPGTTGYTTIYADSVNMELNYDPEYAECFRIRFKMTGFTGTEPGASVHFYHSTDNSYIGAAKASFDPSYLNSGEYITVTGAIKDSMRELDEVNRLVIHFSGFDKPADQNGVVTIDYAYVGPYESMPDQGELYFDFGNTEEDQIRYDTRTYGYTQFDDPTENNWIYKSTRVSDAVIDNTAGTLSLYGLPTMAAEDWPDIYVDTNIGNTATNFPLSFDPGEAEYFQIRFKMKNFKVGDQLLTNDDGSTTVKTIQPYLNLRYFINNKNTSLTATSNYADHGAYIDSDRYLVVTQSLADAFKNAEEIDKIRVYFGGIESKSAQELGVVTIDYIFIGKESDLPTPRYTVTFADGNGKTLATKTVHKGESVTYTGTTPTKASDATYHYTFKGWDKSLENITADTTVIATFTATAHSWSSSNVDGTNHKNTCACGYTKDEAHTYSYKATKEPTTSLEGALTGTCSVCGGTATMTLPKLNTTDYTKSISKAPTCTETGIDKYTWKTTTYGTFSFYATTEEKGHTVVTDKAVAPTCTATGLTEGKHCSLCSVVLTAQEVVPAKGHTPVYTTKDSETHVATCEFCDHTAEEAHSYTDGLCICGQVEIKEPQENTTWKIGHTLNLASDISVNLAVSKSLLTGFDMDTVYMTVEVDTYKDRDKTGVKTLKLLPVEQGNYYYFTLTGMTAVNMNDRIRSVLHGTKDGQEYYSPMDDYSIADYAYSQMNKAGNVESLKILCADLLRYGAKAQIFKGYRLDMLADSKMTEAHKAFLSDMDSVTFGNTNEMLTDLPNAPIEWKGKALNLDSKVCLKFVFAMGTYTGELSDLSLRVRYTDTQGAEKNVILTNAELYNSNLSYYAFTLDALLAAELRSVVSVQIYEGDTPVSCTMEYSADTYGNNKTGALLDLCKALFAYSDSAKIYFTK